MQTTVTDAGTGGLQVAGDGTALLAMRGVRKAFGATLALRGVDLEVAPGEVLGLIGENGAGKSTLMKVLSGAHQADAGEMTLNGAPYRPTSPLQARRAGVAMIYQELSLAPHLSLTENILLGIEPTLGPFMRWGEAHRQARAALAEVGLGDLDPTTPARRLSVAQQQLVEIARAVALRSRVLVLDEPTSSLAQADIARLFTLIRRLRGQGLAIVYISHFLEEIRTICDRYTVLRDGESVGSGTVAGTPPGQLIAMMVGREVADLYPRHAHVAGDTVLELRELAGLRLPASASLALRRGEVLGIAGLVGAGRSELLRAVFGLDPVRSGTVSVAGPAAATTAQAAATGTASPRRRWQQGLGLVSEDRKGEGLALNLSIADNLTLAHLDSLGPARLVTPGRQHAASAPWIEQLGIRCAGPGQPVGALSGGNQQKVAIARLLHAHADVLLLDEPTRGVDVGAKAQIYRLIDALARGDASAGVPPRAILIVSSYLPELLGICDRIAVMCRGRLSPARPVADWDEHSLMAVATGEVEVAP